jgi:hypothetical protein
MFFCHISIHLQGPFTHRHATTKGLSPKPLFDTTVRAKVQPPQQPGKEPTDMAWIDGKW